MKCEIDRIGEGLLSVGKLRRGESFKKLGPVSRAERS